MPIYESQCNSCHTKFESLRSFAQADHPISCAGCGTNDCKRLVSRFNALSEGLKSSSGSSCSSCSSHLCASCSCH